MSGSAVPATKAALVALLTTAVASQTSCVVHYGAPLSFMAGEAIWVANAREDQEPHTIGNRRRAQAFEIDVVVQVGVGGSDQQYATERAYALVALVEAALRNDHQLATVGGVPDLDLVQTTHMELEETTPDVAEAGRVAAVTVTVSGIAYI